jgi:hypothetical protein
MVYNIWNFVIACILKVERNVCDGFGGNEWSFILKIITLDPCRSLIYFKSLHIQDIIFELLYPSKNISTFKPI